MMTRSKFSASVGARSIALAAGVCLGTATVAQAATFTWDFSGTFGQPADANPPGDDAFAGGTFSGANTSTLTWGNPTLTGLGNPLNSLSVVSAQGSTDLAPGVETSVQVVSISWMNASVFGSGGIWNTLLSLDGMFGHQGFGSVPYAQTLSLNVNNTFDPSSTPAVNNASGLDPDVITLDLGLLGGLPVDLGGGMSVLGFSAGITSVGQCGTANPGTTGSFFINGEWTNCEGNTSVLGLSARVRYVDPIAPIPLPATAWLLLGGLAGLSSLRALRRKTVG